jgi:ATP-dependent Zn protease
MTKHRALLDRVANALLEHETLSRDELLALFGDVELESRSTETVGLVRALNAER